MGTGPSNDLRASAPPRDPRDPDPVQDSAPPRDAAGDPPATELDLERARAEIGRLAASERESFRRKIPAVLPGPDEDPGPEVRDGRLIGRLAYLNGQTQLAAKAVHRREPDLPPAPEQDSSIDTADLNALFARAAELDQLTLADLSPERTAIAWRLARETARCLLLIMPDEPLLELPMRPDPWDELCTPILANQPSRGGDAVRICATRRRALLELERARGGLLPPNPNQTVVDLGEYDPVQDSRLRAWLNAMGAFGSVLMIGRKERERLALEAMIDPELCRLAWPSREEIILHDETLAMLACESLAAGSIPEALEVLTKNRGLTNTEAMGCVRLGMQQLRERTDFDLEDQRSLMAARVDDYVRRCRLASDLDREIKGLKLLTVVQGLTRTEPENAARAFVAAVTEVTQAQIPKALTDSKIEIIDVPIEQGP